MTTTDGAPDAASTAAPTAAPAPPGAHEITYHVYPTDCDVFGHVNHATMITIRQAVRHAATGRVHAEATISFVCLDQAGRPVPVPERWRSLFPTWTD